MKHTGKCQASRKRPMNSAIILAALFKHCKGLREHSQKEVLLISQVVFTLLLGEAQGGRRPVFKRQNPSLTALQSFSSTGRTAHARHCSSIRRTYAGSSAPVMSVTFQSCFLFCKMDIASTRLIHRVIPKLK